MTQDVNIHFDYEIYFVQMEKLFFLHLLWCFLSLSKAGCYIIDFIVHVSSHFLQSTLHWSCFIFISFSPQSISFYLPQSISFIFTLFGCIHITWSFNLIVSFTFQPIRSLEINNLRVSLDKFLILDRCSLLEAVLRWFYYSLSLYMKQEIQHRADFIWWLKTTLHPLIILAVKKLMSLRNMKPQ